MVDFGLLSLKVYSSSSVCKVVASHISIWPRMPRSTANSSNTFFVTSSNAFSRSMKIVTERDLHPLQRAVIGAAVYVSVAMASIVRTPLLKPREYGLIGWANHLTLASTNRSMTFKKPEVVKWDDACWLSLESV